MLYGRKRKLLEKKYLKIFCQSSQSTTIIRYIDAESLCSSLLTPNHKTETCDQILYQFLQMIKLSTIITMGLVGDIKLLSSAHSSKARTVK